MTVFVETQLELAGQVLDLVRAEFGRSAEAAVHVAREELGLTRFANSFIHQNVASATVRVSLRLHHNGRTATGFTTNVDADGLRALVGRTAAAGALVPPDPRWPGLAPPAAPTAAGNVDEATATAAPADRAARVREFVDAAGLPAAGYCRTTHVSAAFVDTAGQTLFGTCTEASLDGVARAPQPDGGFADGVAKLASVRLSDVDATVLGQRAGAKARAAADPVDLPPGHYEVVLEPSATRDLLSHLGWYGFNGKAFVERRSFVVLGAAQFDPAVSLVDDPLAPDVPGLPFDAEGTPKRRLDLVRDGESRAVAHDRRTARQAETESTGHGAFGSETFGPMPHHPSILPAGGADAGRSEVEGPVADATVPPLLAGVRRGLLVSDFWYTRVLDPRTVVVTGLTRNGLWLVEDGAVTRPVKNLRFTQSYPEALGPGRVLGVGAGATLLPDGGLGVYRAPALRLGSWHFTGGAAG